MRVRLFSVLSVSVMLLAASAPAVFAQDTGTDRDDDDVSCLQVQNAFGNQGQYGNANAQYGSNGGGGGGGGQGGDGGVTVAEVAQELGISQDQVLNCIGVEVTSDDDRGDVNDADDIVAGTGTGKPLPNTGGPPLLTTAFALAMVATSVALLGVRVRRGP